MIQKLLVIGVLLFSGVGCFGQVERSATAASIPLTAGASFSYFDASYQSIKATGISAFIDYSPLLIGKLGVEGEGRWLIWGGPNSFREYNYLVGPRYHFQFKGEKYQPYAKFLVGAGEINFPYGLGHGGYFAMAPGGGVDIALNEHWKLRGDYEFQFWPSAPGIPDIQSSSFHPNGVSVGFVYRLFRPRYQLAGPQ